MRISLMLVDIQGQKERCEWHVCYEMTIHKKKFVM